MLKIKKFHKLKSNKDQFLYFVLISLIIVLLENVNCEILINEEPNLLLPEDGEELIIEYQTVLVGQDNQIRVLEDSVLHEINGNLVTNCSCVNGHCIENICTCDPYYELVDGFCYPCPDLGKDCQKCCFGDHLQCISETCVLIDSHRDEAFIILTASQVILTTAMILGITALASILLRVCTQHRRYLQSRRPEVPGEVPDNFQRTWLRVSVSSLQQRVLNKLRDRPPRYETRHNYEYRQNELIGNGSAQQIPTISRNFYNEPPPSYENQASSRSENDSGDSPIRPPAYERIAPRDSIIVPVHEAITSTQLSVSEDGTSQNDNVTVNLPTNTDVIVKV